MINQLDKSLRRLLKESHADAAVLWVQRSKPAGAAVLMSCPAGLVPAGTEWPVPETLDLETVVRDPARLAAMVPTSLRLQLAGPPAAAQSFALGEDLLLLIVWCDAAAPAGISEVLRHVIRHELSYLAQLVEDARFAQGESDRMLAVTNALQEGVVSVDPHLGRANINEAAAALLGLPEDHVSTSQFAAAMADLAGRALNWDEAASSARTLQHDPMAVIDDLWRFAEPPTHLRVRSRPVRLDAFRGRIWTLTDESDLAQALDDSERGRALIRATTDAMIDPQALVQTVTDDTGSVVDLVYLDANRATCDYLRLAREDLIGRSAGELLPDLEASGLLSACARCAETGAVQLDDFSYFDETLDEEPRRYDVRVARVRPGVLTITWRDVTERYRAARRIAESEEQFRLLAENSADVVTRVRDGILVWVSPSIEAAFGAPPDFWIGRKVSTMIPPGGEAAQGERLHDLAAGRTVLTRVELVGPEGVRHWVQLHAKPVRDADGSVDGFTASMRIIDAEVAAEQAAEEARRKQAAADALYRESMDSAAVGMCLADTVGNFIDINQAMCDFFGYSAAAIRTKTWMDLTAPDYLQADIDQRAAVLAGRIDSYRMVKRYIHADGHSIWGDLSIGCIRGPDGQVEVFVGQINDITAEVQAREQLTEAHARQARADALYRRSMDSAAVGMCLTDADGNFTDVNKALADYFGYRVDTLRTMCWQQVTAPGYLQEDIDNVAEMQAGRMESYRRVKQFVHADGHPLWGDLSVGCVRARDGQVETFVAQVSDITAEIEGRRKLDQARAAQAAADARYRLLMDNSAVAMNVCDNRGRFQIVNPAMSEFFGYDAATMLTKTWEELTAPEYLAVDTAKMHEVLDGHTDSYRLTKEYIHADGHPIWGDLSISCIRSDSGAVENFIAQIVDVTAEVTAHRAEDAANARYRRLMDNSPIAMNVCGPDGRFQSVNHAMCDFFGYDEATLKTKTWQDLTAPGFLDDDLTAMDDLGAGRLDVYRVTKQYIHSAGDHIWGDLSVSCVRSESGRVQNFVAQIIDVTAEVEARREIEQAQARQAQADARYRRLMAGSSIGMTLITPDGRFDVVNEALCRFFGYDEATLRTKTWQELTAAEFLDSDLEQVEDVLAGRIDSYRMIKQYIHADGQLIWGDLSVSCLRDTRGQVERFVSQITDVTAEVEARRQIAQRDQQNRVLTRRLQAQTDRMKAELDSAAGYVASLLPDELTGAVRVTSTYLPSRELGGDCYGYSWVDDDNLVFYLIDVSGHGIAPALMSVSVLNVLRSESLPRSVMLEPAAVLGALNANFAMEQQGGNYFTVFYGAYHQPTRTLRYATAGHPPALLLSPGTSPVRLATDRPPIGMFDDTAFVTASHQINAGESLLVYSDGAFELPLPGGRHGTLDTFVDLCAAQSAAGDLSLDRLTADLLRRTAGGQFEDDCSLVLLRFD